MEVKSHTTLYSNQDQALEVKKSAVRNNDGRTEFAAGCRLKSKNVTQRE
jgi:hypothetical protein